MRRRWQVALVVGSLLGGCARLLGSGDDRPSSEARRLEDAEVKSMAVDIRRDEKTICPWGNVQMAVFAKVVLPGQKAPVELETPGGEQEAPDRLVSFEEFAFHSEQGTFNANGVFTPEPDLLLTAAEPFKIKTVYKKRPDKFTFETSYPPDYACIEAVGFAGPAGSSGQSGSSGDSGRSGSSNTNTPGESGGDGGNGSGGGGGGDGGRGPEVEAYATLVKTPFYDRLVAVIALSGGEKKLALFDPDGPVKVYAAGGTGGSGGAGGGGGSGGAGGTGSPGGAGGKGGAGGPGGNGGKGGPGGTLVLVYDKRFPELASLIQVSAPGGGGGGAGSGGFRGSGGQYGSGWSNAAAGSRGSDGNSGPQGQGGASGSPGSARAKAGEVAGRFADLPGITVLGQKRKGKGKGKGK